MPEPVLRRVVAHLEREAAIGGYEAHDEAGADFEAVYDSIARLVGATRDEIAMVENATRAWDMAFYGIAFKPGDRILTSMQEYASNVISFLQVAKRGVSVEPVPSDASGQMDVAALRAMLDDRVKLVAVSHMPTNGGLVQPAAEIGKACREAGVLYLLDACQTVGQMPVDVEEIGCDMLSATSRKYLRGPRGIGFLYVRSEILDQLEPPFLDLKAATWVSRNEYQLRPDARRFENWERYIAGQLGMGVAAEYALDIGLDRIWERVQERGATLRSRLNGIPGVRTWDIGAIQGGIVTFTVEGHEVGEITTRLAKERINTTSSSPSSTRYDAEARKLPNLVRASVHYVTSDEEMDRLEAVVRAIARG